MTRAIVAPHSGGPEVLAITDTAELAPGAGELLVETAAVGVNFIETYQRSGLYAVNYPFTPGAEASGRVLAVGAGVTGFAVGDLITTAEARGTYADRFLVLAVGAVKVPDTIDAETAAALPLQGLTAHYLANSAANPQPGDTVLVHAGAGGVGLLLTQLLAARGVRVLTTVSAPQKRDLSLAAGAAEVLSYGDFADRVREITAGAGGGAGTAGPGVAVVYDGVGKDTFDDSLRSLRVRGQMVLFGAASGPVPPFDLQRLNAAGSLSITRPSLAFFLRTPEERAWRYGELFAAIAAGTLDVRIGARFPLAAAAAAHTALEARATTGKVILTL